MERGEGRREEKRGDSATQDSVTPTAKHGGNQEPKLGLPDLRPIFVQLGLLLKWHQRGFF